MDEWTQVQVLKLSRTAVIEISPQLGFPRRREREKEQCVDG